MVNSEGKAAVWRAERFSGWIRPLPCQLVLICSFASFVSSGILTSSLIGAGDALYYLYMLADFVTQFRHGVMPIYVGQTTFMFNGPPILGPYYLYLAAAIDFLTLHALPFILLQHLTAFASFLAAGLAMFWALRSLAPELSWEAAVIACLYIGCPGSAGLLYVNDSYPSLMAFPWVALYLTSVIQFHRNPRKLLFPVIAAVALSLLWMAHPPIALWTSALVGICQFYFFIATKGRIWLVRNCIVTYGLFSILARWYFVSIFETGVGALRSGNVSLAIQASSFVNGALADAALALNKSVVPQVFLPLSVATGEWAKLQLGYSLWILLLLATTVGFLFRTPKGLRAFIACCALLVTVAVPVPYLSSYVLHHLPAVFEITTYMFMLRIYVVLAAVVSIAGLLSLDVLRRAGLWTAPARILGCVILLAWSTYQMDKLLFLSRKYIRPPETAIALLMPEHAILPNYTIEAGGRRYGRDAFDPALENRLLRPDLTAAPANVEYILRTVGNDPGSAGTKLDRPADSGRVKRLHLTDDTIDTLVFKARIEPDRRYALVCRLEDHGYRLETLVSDRFLYGLNTGYVYPTMNEPQIIPIWTTGKQPEDIAVRVVGGCPTKGGCSFDFELEGFGTYNSDLDLPIRQRSLVQYSVDVTTDRPGYLETFRMYLPGYEARVNGRPEEVRRSPDGNAMVAVPAGRSDVVLDYAGTVPMRFSWWFSLIAWIATLAYLSYAAISRVWQN
jgi:hypothetical protein